MLGTQSPDVLNSHQENWYTQLKLRQLSAQENFRLPVIQNYAKHDSNMQKLVEHKKQPYDLRHVLQLGAQDTGEYHKQLVDKPIQFDPRLMDRVRNASAVDDDNDSVVSDTLSVDEPGDNQAYKAAKENAKESVSDVKALRKASDALKGSIERLEKKAANGGLTAKESAKLKRLQESAIDTLVEAHKTVPKAQSELRALKRGTVRDIVRGHLQKTSAAPTADEEEKTKAGVAKALAGSVLKLTTEGELWYQGRHVYPNALSLAEAEKIDKELLKQMEDVDTSTAEGAKVMDKMLEHQKDVEARIQGLKEKKAAAKAAKAAAKAAAAAPATEAAADTGAGTGLRRAPSRGPSRATSPAPAEEEGEGDAPSETPEGWQ